MFNAIVAHARRVSYHLGNDVKLGAGSFRMRGYFASRFDTSPNIHEKFLIAVLQRRLMASSGAFIDVGVNVGQTLAKVLSIDRSRDYVGFEPQLECCYSVEQFLRLNNLRNATVLPLALSDSNKTMTLYSSSPTDEMASLVDGTTSSGAKRPFATKVQTRIGDELLGELNVASISAIKIDVEGAELFVLKGLRGTLSTKRPPVIFEVLPNFFGAERVMKAAEVCRANTAMADEIFSFFSALGYSVNQIHSTDGSETPISKFTLDDTRGFAGSNFVAYAN